MSCVNWNKKYSNMKRKYRKSNRLNINIWWILLRRKKFWTLKRKLFSKKILYWSIKSNKPIRSIILSTKLSLRSKLKQKLIRLSIKKPKSIFIKNLISKRLKNLNKKDFLIYVKNPTKLSKLQLISSNSKMISVSKILSKMIINQCLFQIIHPVSFILTPVVKDFMEAKSLHQDVSDKETSWILQTEIHRLTLKIQKILPNIFSGLSQTLKKISKIFQKILGITTILMLIRMAKMYLNLGQRNTKKHKKFFKVMIRSRLDNQVKEDLWLKREVHFYQSTDA